MAERKFFYSDGRFFAELAPGVPNTPIGVWELREVFRDMLPAGALPVQILAGFAGDADQPSDTGEPWQTRAVRAELEAADLRARLGALERSVVGRDEADRRVRARERRAREEREVAAERRRLAVLTLAEQVAALYGQEAELARVAVQCEGDHDNHPDGPDHAYAPELCYSRSATADELVAFIGETLRLDHPAVRFPLPGPETLAQAHRVARAELVTPGRTFDDAVSSALRTAAELAARGARAQ